MPIPSVTASLDTISGSGDVPFTAALSASATESPSSWEWLMLDVPCGSTDNVGSNGDFTNGTASIQTPSFTANTAGGTYVCQVRASNSFGWSEPTTDMEKGQTDVIVKTSNNVIIPGSGQYSWGSYLNTSIRGLESFATGAIDIRGINVTSSTPSDGDTFYYNGSANKWGYVSTASFSGSGNATQIQGVGVTSSSPTNGDMFVYNSSAAKWALISSASLTGSNNATQIQGIDVTSSAPSDGDMFIYRASSSKWGLVSSSSFSGSSGAGSYLATATKGSNQASNWYYGGGGGSTVTIITGLDLTFTPTRNPANVMVVWQIPTNGDIIVYTRQMFVRINSGSWESVGFKAANYGEEFTGCHVFTNITASSTVQWGMNSDVNNTSIAVLGGGTAVFGYYPAAKTWALEI